VEGHDAESISRAIRKAKKELAKPTLICCKTIIGFGAPNKQGTEHCHGAPLGAAEIAAAREALGWPYPPFEVPDDVKAAWDATGRGKRTEGKWQRLMKEYRKVYPELAKELDRRVRGDLPADFAEHVRQTLASVQQTAPTTATRQSSQSALNAFAPRLPEMLGGSADLTGSNNTWAKNSKGITRDDATGNYVWYGVREFGMSAIMNGAALHGGFLPYGGTFLVFSDYARNAARMSALMQVPVTYVWTHDSIGLGEDGPTHQPIEHVASLRLIPNFTLWRPCDALEAHVAWADAIERRSGPTALILTRQALVHQSRTAEQVENVRRGGYVLSDCSGAPEVVIIGTGSEVQLAVEAGATLTAEGRRVRVVSMPSTSLFDRQDSAYRDSVLPRGVPRVAVEAGVRDGWCRYTGAIENVVGIDTFGASAPAKDLFEHFGLTAARVAETARAAINA
jgi:transketolase